DNIWVELVRIAHRQFGWQENKPNAVTATRYYRLFNTTEINQICVKKFGVTIKEIFQCGLALLGAFLSRPIIQEDYFRAFAQVTERQIDTNSFVKLICKTDRELRAILKKEQRYDSQFAFAYNSLRAFPLVRLSNGESDTFMCPLPTLLFWRFTAGLYYELVSEENFGHLFGQSVQKYVGDLAVNAFQRDTVTILPEHEYVMGKKRKDSADWIILDQKAALFIECKSKRLSWDTKTNIEDTKPLEKDITQVATAIAQLYKTIGDYTEGRYSNLAYDENLRVYPVLVTLESLHFFGPLILNKIKAAVVEKLAEAGLGENLLTDMPYSICSMTDLEGSFSFMNKVGVSDFMDQKFSDPETSDWSFNSYTSHRIGTIRPRENLFPESYQEIFVGLSLGL
ncbi:MAG: hypothetical protein JNM81_16620, partial [Rhodospirillaceae bacterium]|nr:hypothetical protein [Rhodospirillaceae bacterium]